MVWSWLRRVSGNAHRAGEGPDQSSALPLLEMKLCHVRYGLIPALRGVNISVAAGEMVAILGANGAGKSTTLRTVSGLIRPYSGTITLAGERIDGLTAPSVVRRGVAQVPEGRDLFPGLSVRDNLRYGYWPRWSDGGIRDQIEEVLEAFPKLRERYRQRASTLSGGEQQMLAVGMGLMAKPRLLLVDELSLGLAPLIVGQLFETLKSVNARGTAIVLVEQFVPLALANTHRAYVLAKGEVVDSRPSAELQDDPTLIASYLGTAATSEGLSAPESNRGERTPRRQTKQRSAEPAAKAN